MPSGLAETVFVPVEPGVEREVPELTLQVRLGGEHRGLWPHKSNVPTELGVVGAGAGLAAPPCPLAVFPSSSPCNNRADPSDKAQKHQRGEVQILNSA